MCYAYYDDFERRTKKDSARKPEARTPEPPKDQEPAKSRPRTEGTLWTFLARRRSESEVTEPRIHRIREKV
ncbi:hypothetical protein CQ020_08795 [Arthrobacter sp. MYb23]|uniref:hypothetical protein n=1 Tax=unclassified Arthrobacter TaxID=235627 RepID=UPI000CFAF12A|nr:MULTISPECIES: hypothetical protein [unclassified Arthrobacter]PRB34291.1 hypothetical protein CQ038_22965 [Arthrobacter sp. MYb51]PRB96563.1 hypothetical protein CQ020_08795 [Arthrobacter sp. MYb23]